MIIPDVNVLVYAARNESVEEQLCRAWLEANAAAPGQLAMIDVVLSGVIRVLTNPRVLTPPASAAVAFRGIATLRTHPNISLLAPSDEQWEAFGALCMASDARGNLVTDAYIASFASVYDCEVATSDADFRRFPGIRLVNPAVP